MQELDKLNAHKGTATNAMALFLAINTSSVTLLPTGVIALRASAGSADPAGILPTTLFATVCSTTVAIICPSSRWRIGRMRISRPSRPRNSRSTWARPGYSHKRMSGLCTGFGFDRPSCYRRHGDNPSGEPGYGDVDAALPDRHVCNRGAAILVSGLAFKGR